MRFLVILPEGASLDSAPLPVIYFLHGRGRHERSLLDSATGRKALLATRCAVVLPRGEDGWYMNAVGDANAKATQRYADYLDEVIALAEGAFPLSREASQRAMAGWSMGGFGAAYTVGRQPGRFAALATIIGLLDFPRDPIAEAGQNYTVPLERFGDDRGSWAFMNPKLHVERFDDVAVMVAYASKAFDRQMNEAFIQALGERGNTPHVLLLPGGHTFETVEGALPAVLHFLEERCFASGY